MTRILLTGASGFVGQAALVALARRGAEVHALSRRKPEVAAAYTWHTIDLFDSAATAACVRGVRPDAVLHLAWIAEPGQFWSSPDNLEWVESSLALTRAAAEAGASRFVGVGTCYEYGFPAADDCDEASTPLRPSTLYGVCKDAARRAIEAFSEEAGLTFAWARLFHVYGAGEAPDRLVASVARALVAGETARCASGRPVRDFMDVRDAGEALAAVALSDLEGGVNVATGEANSIADVARKLALFAGRPDLLEFGALPDRPGEPPRISADVKRLQREVGFRHTRSLDDGLRDALKYWASHDGGGQKG